MPLHVRRALTRRVLAVVVALAAAFAVPLATAPPVAAEPATSTAYPTGATGVRYTGQAFDACTAPTLDAIRAWGASPYRALAVYMSGASRTCAQPQLTASWVTEVSKLKWRLIPIHKGLQPPCGARPTDPKISLTLSTAAAQGTAAADEAIAAAKALGMLPGSAFYNDIEFYDPNNTGCRNAVLTYLSAWTKRLHATGYLSGVYMNLMNGAKNLSDVYTSASYARPDALWIARYDGVSSLTGWTNISDSKWAVHQRGKQYRGGHDETYGGVTINIDTNAWDAPVATVAHTYAVKSTTSLNARSGPSSTYGIVKSYAPGAPLRIVCQASGQKVGTTWVWDKLSDGTYVSDYYVSTPSKTTFSAPFQRCTYPWQVNSSTGLTMRTGPGTSYATAGSLPNGALAYVTCQKGGTKVGTTWVWNKLDNGRWVSDYYVANPSNTTFSKPAPRC
ncbi:glycoside hydrolase domain-containing protein [Streptomyces sp. NPDC051940]|uniref:glycoside hydrolase domain-containing protein n=1 Tax=Streptomyces sp. NPDC051940 TaxID=3155675 RepID=UPI003440A11F